jgi:uncharacterized protein involved in outer membrane biogenesis
MKKIVIRIVLGVVVVLVIAVAGLYFYRNSLIRSAVESQANSSLGVKTTLGGAELGLFGGTLELEDLKIGSPQGYSAEQMFTLGELDLGVKYGELRQDPVRVRRIVIDRPKAVLEYVNGKFNFQAMMDQMAGKDAKTEKGKDPVKLIVDELTVKDASVAVRAPMLPSELAITIPTVTLKEVGTGEGSKNGAAIRDVVGAAMSALAAKAAESPQLANFAQLKGQLESQAKEVAGKVSRQLSEQVDTITKDVTGEVNKALEGTGVDVNKAVKDATGGKDPAKTVEKGIGDLLGGKKKEEKK